MPYDDVEGSNTGVMGRFITAVEALFEMSAELPKERPLAEWPEVLRAITAQFFLPETPEEVADMRFIQTALDQLGKVAQLAGGAQVTAFRAVRHFLSQLLDEGDQRGAFFTGGVTFCALKPMRSIPARVICLIGMDDEAFPRRTSAPGFDLMARESQCGDRSSRDDDRFSFLEAIISARGHLYASYLGRSIIDNGEIPPSVLISELLDYMDQAFVFPGGKNARAFTIVEHRLHAFSRRYFDGSDTRLFSYSTANAAASANLQKPPVAEISFLSQSLPEPGAEMRNVGLRSLADFFANPARYFSRHRLGIRFDEEDDLLEDSEIFDLVDLEKYKVKQALVTDALEKHTPSPEEFAARGISAPTARVGEARFRTLRGSAAEFYKTLEPELRGRLPAEPLAVDLRIGEFTLTGKIESIYGDGIVQFRFASLKAKDWLGAWINHLAKCATSQDRAGQRRCFQVGDGEVVKFAPVKNAAGVLSELLEIYWNGLRSPLHFFAAGALDYAQEEMNPRPRGKTSPIDLARKKWNGDERRKSGEKHDAYNAFCFTDTDPLDADFTRLALLVFGPMLRHATVT